MFYELFIIKLSIQLRKYNRKEKLQRIGFTTTRNENILLAFMEWSGKEDL